MSWEAIGTVAEIAGAIAVVVTLIYLARQIRQSTRMMHREAHLDRVRHIADPLIASPDRLREILAKVTAKDGSREPVILAFMDAYDLEYEEAIAYLGIRKETVVFAGVRRVRGLILRWRGVNLSRGAAHETERRKLAELCSEIQAIDCQLNFDLGRTAT